MRFCRSFFWPLAPRVFRAFGLRPEALVTAAVGELYLSAIWYRQRRTTMFLSSGVTVEIISPKRGWRTASGKAQRIIGQTYPTSLEPG